MTRLLTATAIGLVLAITTGCAQDHAPATGVAAAAAPAAPTKVDNFRLVDQDGRAHDLYRLKDAPAVVLVMHGIGSPDVHKMAPALEQLRATYAAKGVEFLMINSTLKDKRADLAAEAKVLNVSMPILKDEQQLIGEQLGATRTSEVMVINPKTWMIAYRGPLNSELAGKTAKAGTNFAADALDAVISDQAVPVAYVAPTGGAISFPDHTAQAKAGFAKISYSKTVAPLIEEKCIACHEEGGIAPFSFDSYTKIKGFAPMIREVIRTDRMPPWDADADIGHFKDDKSLTPDQIKTLVHWIEAGAPRGEGADPLLVKKHVAPEWPLGKPDLIVDVPSFKVPASGVVDYQYPIVDNPLTEGKWLKASTAKVDQRQAVHHVLSGFITNEAKGRGMTSWGGSVGGYTVGMESVVQPKDIGTYIPAGGKFGYQMHYTPFGKEVTANTKIGLYFYKDGENPKLMMREKPLVDQFIDIPANDGNHKEVAYFDFPKDATLYTAVVHAHYRGTYSKLEIRYPSGEQKVILNVPFYDFNWQRMYEFAEPIAIPAGSKLIATYIYDNSKRNPANPDPNKEITWGDQSFEEMFYTSLRYRWNDETVANQTNYDDLLEKTRLLGMLDDNIDGKVEENELRGQFKTMLAGGKFALVDTNHDGGIDQAEFDAVMGMMQRGRRAAPAAETNGK